jgi:hypothetical protein
MTIGLAAKALAWAAVLLLAFVRPRFAQTFFAFVETAARRLAGRPLAVCVAFGALVLIARAALLPVWQIPKPIIWDEFSYILAADTFAHGRLANPAHPLWQFFDSAYVLQHPTYASKYPPGQGLFLALGQTLFGDPWFGVWLSCGAMAAVLLWALQAWLPPRWALFGAVLALPLAIDSYWMNSYWGGAVAAIGGALALGGYAHVVRRRQPWHGITIGVGLAILANTRPYEGLLFSIPLGIALIAARRNWSAIGFSIAVLAAAAAATGYYNHAVTGHALVLPYSEYTRQYSKIPLFNIQPMRNIQVHGTTSLYDLLERWEPERWSRARSWQLIPDRLNDWKSAGGTILGNIMMLVPLLAFLPWLWRDRRIRLPLTIIALVLAGSWIEVCYYQHYFAPAAAALLLTSVQSFRHLRLWQTDAKPVGLLLSRAIPCMVLATVLIGRVHLLARPEPLPLNSLRDQAAALISNGFDRHVILVRCTAQRTPHEEWVYNGADIDNQEVIWAHDLGDQENKRLLEYYKDRKIWLYEPDTDFKQLNPYHAPSAEQR